MTNDHATALVLAWRDRADARARDELVREHQALVRLWVGRNAVARREHEDAVQEGNLGLLRAIDLYRPEAGASFFTYASIWVRASVRRFVHRTIGQNDSETHRAIRAARRALEREGRAAGAGEIASATGIDEAEVLAALAPSRHVSLDAPSASADSGAATLYERLAIEGPSAEDVLEAARAHALLRASVARALRFLGPRERAIAERRWLSDEPATLREVGEAIGCSYENVRRLEERALDVVGAILRARGIGARDDGEAA